MAVKAINSSLNTRSEYAPQKDKNGLKKDPSFTGFENPVTVVMDAIDRGGFAASFVIQDGLGMVTPRIWEGLNRNRKRKVDPKTGEETGRRTGPLNWEFARREGIREILSGPSAFIIPMFIMGGIKKLSGTANNVHVDHINALGKTFANYVYARTKIGENAANAANTLSNGVKVKEEFYERVFKNVLGASLEGKLSGEELSYTAKEFTKAYIDVENAKSKGGWKTFIGKSVESSKEDLRGALLEKYMNLRKKLLPSSINELDAVIPVEGTTRKVKTDFSRVLSSMSDFSNDAIKHSKQFIGENGIDNIDKYLKDLTHRRIGTRMLSIVTMFAAVVGFYNVIPKLYNIGLKHDPGLKGLVDEQDNTVDIVKQKTENITAATQKADKKTAVNAKTQPQSTVEFTGGMSTAARKILNHTTVGAQTVSRKLGEFANESDMVQKTVKEFEFNGAAMSVPAMLTLLFGFCLPPRYKNAKSDKERKEILVRDISSFTAILFGANALSRFASVGLGKMSGMVLSIKPEDHNKSIFHKLKNYFTPANGVTLLKGSQIAQKYSNLEGFADRINGFVDFIENGGGNIKTIFNMDKTLRKNVETILGKSLKDSTVDEIKTALKSADVELLNNNDSIAAKAMKNIYNKFGANNKFIKIAKNCNSGIGAMATLVLTPLFMIAVARYCESMTKKRVAEEQAAKAAEEAKNAQETQSTTLKTMLANTIPTQKPSMTGFLNDIT